MKKVNIDKLKEMVRECLQDNNVNIPLKDFSVDGSSRGFKFEYNNIEVFVEKNLNINSSTSNGMDYSYTVILNDKKEKIFR